MHVLSTAQRADVVRHLMEGAGVRPASRLTTTHKTTISKLTLKLGAGCTWLHNAKVWGLSIGRLELDEMHSFIHTREQNLRGDEPKEWGESWLWLAVASTAKLIVSYRVGETRGERDVHVVDPRGAPRPRVRHPLELLRHEQSDLGAPPPLLHPRLRPIRLPLAAPRQELPHEAPEGEGTEGRVDHGDEQRHHEHEPAHDPKSEDKGVGEVAILHERPDHFAPARAKG